MIEREFTEAEILDQDFESIESSYWRHGTDQTFVFELDGVHWSFQARVHHEDGLQLDGPVTATQVHQVDKVVKVWEPVP